MSGQVFIKIYTRDLKGKDADLLNITIENGKIKTSRDEAPVAENVRKADTAVIKLEDLEK